MQKCNRSCTLASRNESPGLGQGLQRAASLCQDFHLGNLPSQYCTVSLQLSGTDLCLHHRSITIHAAQLWEKPKVPGGTGGVAPVVLPHSGLGPQAIAARVDCASLHHGQAGPQQPQHKVDWSHHPSQQLHKQRDGAWLVIGPGPCQ